MTVLKWDQDSERLYETGVKKPVLYPYTAVSEKIGNLDTNYANGVAWNGMSSITESPSGAESNPVYANDAKYLDLRSAEEFAATIEAYTYPKEWEICDGSANLTTGDTATAVGTAIAGVSLGQQVRKPFGLSYRTVLGNDEMYEDYSYKLHLIYKATASPSEKQYQTVNDSPEAAAFSWEIATTPIEVDVFGYKKPTSIITINKALFLAGDTEGTKKGYFDNLEKVLYGSETTMPFLPTPTQVASILSGTDPFTIVGG